MCQIRQAKVDKIAEHMGDIYLDGQESGDVLLVGWGSTYGAIAKATSVLREEGLSVSHCHLRWINPFHPKLGAMLKGHKKVIVPEMNLGQLVKLLRAEFLVDAEGLNKIQGKPFKVSEIVDKVKAYKASENGAGTEN